MINTLNKIDALKVKFDKHRPLDIQKIQDALVVEYTYESNKIEGNTLTLRETDFVINKGLTIGGKSMNEHLEAINHRDAIAFIKELATNKNNITERDVLQIHSLILRSIDRENAGVYRKVPVFIQGSKHVPPQPFLVAKQMEDLFIWYNENKEDLHPVVLASEMHFRLVHIHPFIDGNGRTSRLLMNLILLQHGYPIAILKGDDTNRFAYYDALEGSTPEHTTPFNTFIIDEVKSTLDKFINLFE